VGNRGPVLEVTFDKDRETKKPVRFEERPGEDPPIVSTLYPQKWALRWLGDPAVVRVRIEAGETGRAAAEGGPVADS